MESVLQALPALFCSSVPEGCFPGSPIDSFLEELEVCFPKIQGPDFTHPLTLIPQDCKLHQRVIAAAQAVFILDVTNELACVGDQQVQYCIRSGRAVYHLAEEVILNGFQQFPGLPTARRAPFPADVGMVEATQQDESLRVQCLLELEQAGFVNGLPLTGQPLVDTNQ